MAVCAEYELNSEIIRIAIPQRGDEARPLIDATKPARWQQLTKLDDPGAVWDIIQRLEKTAAVRAYDISLTAESADGEQNVDYSGSMQAGYDAVAIKTLAEKLQELVSDGSVRMTIPLAPSWLIGEKSKVAARWKRVQGSDRLHPDISVVNDSELKLFKEKLGATIGDNRVIDPFDPNRSWSVEGLRGPDGLRRWANEDVAPRPGDVFQERLYCIRWINSEGHRRYAAPDEADLARESKVLDLLRERFSDWQRKGYIPSKPIVSGYNTDQPVRERGWTHWHHLFTPRQLLMHGLMAEISNARLG